MRVRIAIILSFALLTVQPVQMASNGSQQCTYEKKTVLLDRCTPWLTAGLLGACLLLTAPQEVLKSLQAQLSLKNLACNFVREYCSWASSTFAHEIGHAFVAKYILKKPYTIYLGSNIPEKTPVSIHNICINGISHLEGCTEIARASPAQVIDFFNGHCQNRGLDRSRLDTGQIKKIFQGEEFRDFQNSLPLDKKKYALFLLAGGIMALAWHHGTKLCTTVANHIGSGSEKTLPQQLKQILTPDSVTLHQIFNTLIPCCKSCDGSVLLRDCFKVSPLFIEWLTMFTQLMPLISECVLAFTNQETIPSAPFHSKLIIGTINYCLQGCFRFHA